MRRQMTEVWLGLRPRLESTPNSLTLAKSANASVAAVIAVSIRTFSVSSPAGNAGHAAWWWHGLLIIDPSTRRLGPDIAPGLFVFIPLDDGAIL